MYINEDATNVAAAAMAAETVEAVNLPDTDLLVQKAPPSIRMSH
jgi:hypothetical protein